MVHFPLMEGHDEIIHAAYVEHLRTTRTLPDRTTYTTNCTRQASGQPPLTYALVALVLDLGRRPVINCDLLREEHDSNQNPWLNTPDPWNRRDNVRVFIPLQDLPDFYRANTYLMRATALLWGLIAVVAAYLTAREVFQNRQKALLATIVFGFTPLLLHLSSYINNDISAVALVTLMIWRTTHLLRRGAEPFGLLVLGVLSGLALLAKVSTLLVLLAVGLALLIDAHRRPGWVPRLLANGLIFALPLILLTGPWLLYGVVNYGDPFGTQTHYKPHLLFDPPLNPAQVLQHFDQLLLTYAGKFGVNKVLLHPATYALLGGLAALALLGVVRGLWRRRITAHNRPVILVLLVALGIFLAGFYYWYTTIIFVTSRLLYPVHIVIVLILVGGWHWLTEETSWRQPLYLVAAGSYMLAGVILTPLAIDHAYATPRPAPDEALANLEGPAYDFDDTIRFLGHQLEGDSITERGVGMVACWEVLKPPERRAAFSVKLVLDGEILADRTSLFGMGSYDSTLWQVGHRFCDRFFIPVDDVDTPDELEAPFRRNTVYDILLIVLDADTFQVDWQATTVDGTSVQYPFIGRLSSVP